MSFLQLFNKKKDDQSAKDQDGCSVLISISTNNEYSFEIKWDHNLEKCPDQLANLIIGLHYGLFADEVISILKDHEGKDLDQHIINNALDLLDKKNNVLKEVAIEQISEEPLIKPTHVFKL
jgi:hypothetical protein|tara:strand:- start:10833 stop:11195 length:363 start_codon:yes stop_codon:yes gene_type:complete